MDDSVPPLPPPPPPVVPPPPVIVRAAARPQSRGRGWMVVALILLALLGVSVLYNLGSLFGGLSHTSHAAYSSRAYGPRLEEAIREDNDSYNKIAIIEVRGVIMSDGLEQGGFGMVDILKAELRRAEEDNRVKAVVLKVDSPGGEVLASDEIYQALAMFQKKSGKPVVASMGSVAASGGYYVSAPCRWIVANELTITGSIGVIMSSWNYRGLMDKVGIQPQTYKSGRFKDMLSGSRDPSSITPEERNMVQGLIDETFGKFKTVVQEGRDRAYASNRSTPGERGRELAEDWQNYADGRVLSGTEAFRLGFVDELGSFKDAVSRAMKLAGITSANLVEYQQRMDFSDLFRLFGKSEAKSVKIELGLEPVPKLQAGRLYFLAPTFVN